MCELLLREGRRNIFIERAKDVEGAVKPGAERRFAGVVKAGKAVSLILAL